tara:strand:- start:219 stop:335 length:117 start_codon:yes stop_codon:yes gene_type:complete
MEYRLMVYNADSANKEDDFFFDREDKYQKRVQLSTESV